MFTFLLLPVVWRWARWHANVIAQSGSPLDANGLAAARRAGVKHPERVRTLVVKCVPPCVPFGLRALAARCCRGATATAGMALGYGIYLRADQVGRCDLLLHELVHTAQYERLGFRAFLKIYLGECLTDGYPLGALEREAREVADNGLALGSQEKGFSGLASSQ